MQSDFEAQFDELERSGIKVQPPLWMEYQHSIQEAQSKLVECTDKEERKKLKATITAVTKLFLDIYHTKVSDIHPHLLFEIGEDSTYWQYNKDTGIYDEMNVSTVRGIVLRMVMRDGITPTVSWVKECLARYRAEYPERGKLYSDFDCTDQMIHVDNGWLDIHTRELNQHTPDILSLGKAKVPFNKKATCPKYDALFDQWGFGEDQKNVLCEFSGYVLTPDISMARMLVLEGEPGTGKSLLANIWTHILSDLAVREYSLESFTDNPRFCRSAFIGKRLVWFNETDPVRSQLGSTMQKMIDGKTFQVERKGVNGFSEHQNVSKCILCTNGLPSNMHRGMESRILYIKYTRVFRGNDDIDNQHLLDEIINEEASGVLNRMLDGLQVLRKQGRFTKIQGQEDIMNEYRRSSSLPVEFLDTYFQPCVDNEKDTFISNKMLNDAFRSYTHNRPGYFDSPDKFSKEILKNAPRSFKLTLQPARNSKGVRGMIGLKLQDGVTFTEWGVLLDSRVEKVVSTPVESTYLSKDGKVIEK